MTATLLESFTSRKMSISSQGTIEIHGMLTGFADSADDAEVLTAALSLTSPTYLVGATYYVRSVVNVERVSQGKWLCSCTYRRRQKRTMTPGTTVGGISIGDQTQRVYASIDTINSYGTNPPNFKQLINVTDPITGQCEGCEWGGGASCIRTVRACFDASVVTEAFIAGICEIQNCMNDAPYKEFAAGELRFLGCDLTESSLEEWEGVFRFGVSTNKTGLSIGGITSISKWGWDYLWVYYEPAVDSSAQVLVRVPRAVYVEQIYYTDDFSALNL